MKMILCGSGQFYCKTALTTKVISRSRVICSNVTKVKHISQDKRQPQDFEVTLKNILSDANKKRCQENLISKELFKSDSRTKNAKPAAVLVPLCSVKGKPSVLFTLRAKHLYDHRGEVSFPGGKMDDSDPDLVFTALRETEEEMGIDPASIDVWGSLSNIPSKNYKNIVTPIVGNCGEVDIEELNHNPHEVEEIFHCTIESLCDRTKASKTQFRTGSSKMVDGYSMPVYFGPYRIWGLTAMVLHLLLVSLAPGLYKFKLNHDTIRPKRQ